MQKFVVALENDIDTVVALTIVFDLMATINRDIDDFSLTTSESLAVVEILKSWDMVMGVIDWSLLEKIDSPVDVMELVLQRQAAKEDKNFQLADELRKKVDEL
jgi:cysteinyl-tRNA synthetase